MSRTASHQFSQQIDRIMKSHSLRGSESLSRLLQYCAKQSLEHPDELLKEYQIAREVYGRGADFDPQSDSCVRVQAKRLRLKLAEYYAGEGTQDPVIVTIPKGSYHLVFETKQSATTQLDSKSAIGPLPPKPPGEVPMLWRFALIALLTCLLVSLVLMGSLLWGHKQ